MIVFALREFAMENAVYWNGRQVGIECDGRILWFSSAPEEAVAAYSGGQRTEQARESVMKDPVVIRNLVTVAHSDGPNFGRY
ncbi:hypothetical protein C0Z16_05040 [Paraburkholderia rhynchosiae]|nr:hypothetical protein C0Z16_05040 [Paraburkholderia rhynchosiae]